MPTTRVVVASILIAGMFVASAAAQGRGRGKGNAGKSEGGTNVAISATFVFGDPDRVTFRNYFTTHKVTAQPLPPGIAKNVARGKPLPPGIAKKALPSDLLLAVSPRAGRDVSFAIVGDMVVAHRSGVVIDVMVGVFK